MRTPGLRFSGAKTDLWWHACRVHEGKLLQPTRLPLQNQSGKERA
jgi:hypothetical protein